MRDMPAGEGEHVGGQVQELEVARRFTPPLPRSPIGRLGRALLGGGVDAEEQGGHVLAPCKSKEVSCILVGEVFPADDVTQMWARLGLQAGRPSMDCTSAYPPPSHRLPSSLWVPGASPIHKPILS